MPVERRASYRRRCVAEPDAVSEITVADIMTREVVCLGVGYTLARAAGVLTEKGISGAPVLAPDGYIVGVVSKSDLIDPARARGASTVEHVMTRVLQAVREADPAMAAIRLMLAQSIHRALVVNDDGKMCGIVSPTDVLRALAQGRVISDPWGDPEEVEFVDLRLSTRRS